MNTINHYDVIIIGGGVVGFSTAYQLLQKHSHLKVAVLEAEAEAAVHQTGHNSGVIHAGVYYTPGSLKAKFCLQGNRDTKTFCREHDIPFQELGKLIVAAHESEFDRMRALAERCKQNGLAYTVLSEKETKERQPGITAVGSIFVADTGIVNWKQVTHKYMECFEKLGGKVFFNQQVKDITEKEASVTIKTKDKTTYECAYMIACAGLYADRVVKMAKLEPTFKIIPFRGEYYKLADKYAHTFRHLIYPVPDPNLPFLGVHFTPQMAGFTTVGPNAVLALAREGYSWSHFKIKDALEILTFMPTWKSVFKNFSATINEFRSSVFKSYYLSRVKKYYAAINADDLIAYPAGVRAQAVDKKGNLVDDFLFVDTPRMLHTCNAPSPAATSSLPIGCYIVEKFTEKLNA